MINKEQIRNLLSGKPSTFMEAISESLSDKAESNVLEETRAIAINLLEMTPGHKKMVGDALKDKTIADTGADETKPTTPKTTVNGAAGGNANSKTARPTNPSKDDNRDDYNQLNDFQKKPKNEKKNFVGKNYTTNERALRSESLDEALLRDPWPSRASEKYWAKKNQLMQQLDAIRGQYNGDDGFPLSIRQKLEKVKNEIRALKSVKKPTQYMGEELEPLVEAGNALNKLKKNAALVNMSKYRDRDNVEDGPRTIEKAKVTGKGGYTKKGEFEKDAKKTLHDFASDGLKKGRAANKFNQRTYSAFIGKTKVVNDTNNASELNDKISGIKKKGKNPTIHVESQELNELSKKTLGKYVKKAAVDMEDHYTHARDVDQDLLYNKNLLPKEKEHLTKLSDREIKKRNNRFYGIHKAVDKMTEARIDELSKDALHSYAEKAMIDQKKRARNYIKTGNPDDLRKFDNRSGGITRAYIGRHPK